MNHFLLYHSVARHPFPHPSDLEILRTAWDVNAQADITGFLVRTAEGFYQVLEGQREAVEALFARISTDDRHHDIRVLSEGPAPGRRFGDWAMGYAVNLDTDPAAEAFHDPHAEDSPELLILSMQGMAMRRGGISGRAALIAV